jgi:hypothetical protein
VVTPIFPVVAIYSAFKLFSFQKKAVPKDDP